MAEVEMDGRFRVKTLKEHFNKETGLTLIVYDGTKLADENSTLSSIKQGDVKGAGKIYLRKNMVIKNWEKSFQETFGVRVRVATEAGGKISDTKLTFETAKKKS